MTFEEYLEKNTYPNKKGVDHSLRYDPYDNTFYLHPTNEGGDTPRYKVHDNTLTPLE